MSNRVRASRKIIVGDEGWNPEIVATLPMRFSKLVALNRRHRKRRQIAERSVPVMLRPGRRIEIARDGRKRQQLLGTLAHPDNNGATARIAN